MVTKGIFICKNFKSLSYSTATVFSSSRFHLGLRYILLALLSSLDTFFSWLFFWIWTQWITWNSVAPVCALGVCITLAKMFQMIPCCFEMLLCTLKPIRCAHSTAAVPHKHIMDQMSIEQGSHKSKRWTELGSPCTTVLWTDSVCSRPGQCLSLAPWHLSCTNSHDGVGCLI